MIDCNLKQEKNASVQSFVNFIPSGNVTEIKFLHTANEPVPISLTDAGITIDYKFEQYENKLFSIFSSSILS